jgi:hypothetical protein
MAAPINSDPDAIRDAIRQRLKETGYQMAQLSRDLGYKDAYIHQYLEMRKPVELDWKHRLQIRNILGMPMHLLGIDLPLTFTPLLGEVPADVRAIDPALWTGSYPLLPIAPPLAYYQVLTDVLNEHPKHPVNPGDVLVVDQSKSLPDLETEDIAIALLCDRKENGAQTLHGTLIAREFVKKHLLVTNSRTQHHILNITDRALSFQVLLIGKLAYSIHSGQ